MLSFFGENIESEKQIGQIIDELSSSREPHRNNIELMLVLYTLFYIFSRSFHISIEENGCCTCIY